MIISLIGLTDRRPVIYTLLKLLQPSGDILLITNERHYARLIEDEESIGITAGHFKNTLIVVSDATPDEASSEIGYSLEDFEYIIYDNKYYDKADLTIFVKGANVSQEELDIVEYLDKNEYSTLELGFGKKCVPYSVKMFQNVEKIEAYQHLLLVDSKLANAVIKLLAPAMHVSEKELIRVVNSK